MKRSEFLKLFGLSSIGLAVIEIPEKVYPINTVGWFIENETDQEVKRIAIKHTPKEAYSTECDDRMLFIGALTWYLRSYHTETINNERYYLEFIGKNDYYKKLDNYGNLNKIFKKLIS